MEEKKLSISVKNIGKVFKSGIDFKSTLREKLTDFKSFRKKPFVNPEFWALRNVSFEIYKGEITGLIGANGAGKSTLLKLLAQVMEPSEGEMEFRGKVVSILEIGTGFHPDLTGFENIALSGSLLGMSYAEIEKKLPEIVAFSELGDFLHKQIKYYSSGMFLRLAFSVCTHLDADILLLDEVISVGDAAFAVKSLKRIKEIAAAGRTIVLASHDLNSIQHICTKCILLDKGGLVEVGDTTRMLEKYIDEGVFKTLSNSENDLSSDEQFGTGKGSYFITSKTYDASKIIGPLSLSSLSVFASTGSRDYIDMSMPLTVECRFKKHNDRPLNVSFLFNYNMQSSVVSVDYLNRTDQSSDLLQGTGAYKVQCNFPGVFFNHGTFAIGLYFTDAEGNVIYAEDNALIFKIAPHKLSNGELYYRGKFLGPIYPRLNWMVEKLV